jgi:hypothetical protein
MKNLSYFIFSFFILLFISNQTNIAQVSRDPNSGRQISRTPAPRVDRSSPERERDNSAGRDIVKTKERNNPPPPTTPVEHKQKSRPANPIVEAPVYPCQPAPIEENICEVTIVNYSPEEVDEDSHYEPGDTGLNIVVLLAVSMYLILR